MELLVFFSVATGDVIDSLYFYTYLSIPNMLKLSGKSPFIQVQGSRTTTHQPHQDSPLLKINIVYYSPNSFQETRKGKKL